MEVKTTSQNCPPDAANVLLGTVDSKLMETFEGQVLFLWDYRKQSGPNLMPVAIFLSPVSVTEFSLFWRHFANANPAVITLSELYMSKIAANLLFS